MALSSVSVDFNRDNSPSLSPLSSTVIHYRQKYEKRKISQHNHREVRKHNYFEKQHNRNRSHRNSSFRQHNHRYVKRRQSPCLWEEHKSSNGRIYYYNIITDQSQWEKPRREQLSSSSIKIRSINKNNFHSKRFSNNNNYLFVNNEYYSKKSNLISISNENFNSTRNQSSYSNKKSSIYHQSINKNDRNKSMIIDNHKRKKDNIENDLSFKKFRKDKSKNDDFILLTPTSPPPNEIIQIDHVDPFLTGNNCLTNISIPFINSSKKSHYHILSNSLLENIFKLFHRKQSIKTQINKDLSSSSIIIQSSLCSNLNIINPFFELEHSSSIINSNSNSNDIKRYYRADLIQHLLNWPSTQIEREFIHLSNEQTRIRTCQLTSLRTDLYSIRLRLERNRFQLLKYHHILTVQQHLINQLQLIDSD